MDFMVKNTDYSFVVYCQPIPPGDLYDKVAIMKETIS